MDARKVVDTIPVPYTFSSDEALSADGKSLWVSHKLAGKVSVVDIPNRKVVTPNHSPTFD
jgi:hypothetical protein